MKATDRVSIGTTGSRTVEVTHEMTVAHFHEHMPAVFGTPIMIYHMEVAAADAVHEFLPQGWISVGVAVDVKHLAATPVGLTVTARATVIAVDDNTITFQVEAHDGIEKIGEGLHVRAPVQMERFESRVKRKAEIRG